MTYAKYISETSVSYRIPQQTIYDGKTYYGDLTARPDILKSLGFLPVVDEPYEDEIPEKHHLEERFRLNNDFSEIIRYYIVVEDEKRNLSLSRRKIMNEMKEREIWTQVKEFLVAMNLWEDFEMSTTLDEQEPLMQNAIGALKSAFHLSDETIEEILVNSAAE